MGIKERKEREKAALRKQILDAAGQLFREVGYEKTTMRKIAKRIEYNPATIYSYFKNKEEIFFELQRRAFQLFYESLRHVGEIEDPGKRLTSMGRAYLKFAIENPDDYDLMFIMRQPMQVLEEHEKWKLGEKNFDLLHRTVQECIEAEILPPEDSEAMAAMVWSSVHGLASLQIRGRFKMKQFKNEDLDFILYNAFYIFDRILLQKYAKREE